MAATTVVNNGDVIIVEHRDVFYLACCDCGLTHEIEVKIDPDVMQVSLEVHRHGTRTRAMRQRKTTRAAIQEVYDKWVKGRRISESEACSQE